MQKISLRSIQAFLFLFLINGCATLNQEQCQTMNWTNRGHQDGKEGVPAQQIEKYRKQCSEFNIAVDQKKYMRGHQEGIKLFCTYENGVQQGEDGEKNAMVCPQESAADFNKGHVAGYKVYKLQKELERQKKEQEEQEEEQKNADIARANSDEETLRNMNECSFDSDCSPRKCESKYMTVGSASGYVRRCE